MPVPQSWNQENFMKMCSYLCSYNFRTNKDIYFINAALCRASQALLLKEEMYKSVSQTVIVEEFDYRQW